MDEGGKGKQEEGDIKEKLVHSTLNKDLISRNEKVQVQVKGVPIFIWSHNLKKQLLCFPGSAPALQGCENEELGKCSQTAQTEVFQCLCCSCNPNRWNRKQVFSLDHFDSSFCTGVLWNWNTPRRNCLTFGPHVWQWQAKVIILWLQLEIISCVVWSDWHRQALTKAEEQKCRR